MFKVIQEALSNKIEKLNFFYFITLLALICKISSTLLAHSAVIISKKMGYIINFNNQSWLDILILGILFAPIIETIIFQAGIYHLLNTIPFFRDYNNRIVLIGGLIFGLSHAYNIIYIISVIPAGMILMYAYIVRQKKNDAFLSVYSIHLICNIIALIFKLTN